MTWLGPLALFVTLDRGTLTDSAYFAPLWVHICVLGVVLVALRAVGSWPPARRSTPPVVRPSAGDAPTVPVRVDECVLNRELMPICAAGLLAAPMTTIATCVGSVPCRGVPAQVIDMVISWVIIRMASMKGWVIRLAPKRQQDETMDARTHMHTIDGDRNLRISPEVALAQHADAALKRPYSPEIGCLVTRESGDRSPLFGEGSISHCRLLVSRPKPRAGAAVAGSYYSTPVVRQLVSA